MNERISDIALEVLKDQPTLETWTFTNAELQQFAQLIIKDCASLVKDVYISGGNTYLHHMYERYGMKYDWQE